jgi:hypothetical protein
MPETLEDVERKIGELEEKIRKVETVLETCAAEEKATLNALLVSYNGQLLLLREKEKELRLIERAAPGQLQREGKIEEALQVQGEALQSLTFMVHAIGSSVIIREIDITPSEHCKSKACGIFKKFTDALRLQPPLLKALPLLDNTVSIKKKLGWRQGLEETSVYPALAARLQALIDGGVGAGHVVVTASGTDLLAGNLFDVNVYGVKPRDISSELLRATREEPKLCCRLHGRTDLVVSTTEGYLLGSTNTLLAVEVKVMQLADEHMREAFLQLVGLNCSNSARSPPVILTNLDDRYILLYIAREQAGEVRLEYSVKFAQYPTLEEVFIAAVEVADRPCITTNFARMPTPTSSPVKQQNVFLEAVGSDDDGDSEDDS